MTSSSRAPLAGGSRFRPDIEGMRAVAVGMVLIHHAGVSLLPGGFAGVDVFFVISGFVITMQLLRELDQNGHIGLVGFYGRRAKRLLPAAGVVLLFTTIASWLMVSRVQWATISNDIVGAALYVVNWVLANRAVDYNAEDVEPSPVQHFWSLAVEEQFYFIWPIIILALAWAASWRRRRTQQRGDSEAPTQTPRGLLAVGLIVMVVLPSLVWSVYLTEQNPDRAYFVTTTRLWELGLGALVAIGTSQWQKIRPKTGGIIAWLGLSTVVAGALLQNTSVAWPGTAALVPTLGTAAVLVGGWTAAGWGPQMILGRRGMVWVGGLSYSLYLWHWPFLRMAQWQWGALTAWVGLGVVVASVVPAWLCYRLVENPIRRSPGLNTSPRFALSVGFNATLVAVLAGLVLGLAATSAPSAQTTASVKTLGVDDVPTKEASGDSPLAEVVTPEPANATRDLPEDANCQADREDELLDEPCTLGDPDGDIRVAIMGDSKMNQWLNPLDSIGTEQGWQMEVYTKSGCAFSKAVTVNGGVPYEACLSWNDSVFDALLADPPDVLLTSSVRDAAGQPESSAAALAEGYLAYWEPLVEQGTRVVVLSSTPAPTLDTSAYECVAEHPDDFDSACTWAYKLSTGSKVLKQALADLPEGTGDYVDMDPWVCPEGTCVGVYRNVLTYRQGTHITATFTDVLRNPLASRLVPFVEGTTSEGAEG